MREANGPFRRIEDESPARRPPNHREAFFVPMLLTNVDQDASEGLHRFQRRKQRAGVPHQVSMTTGGDGGNPRPQTGDRFGCVAEAFVTTSR